MFNFFSKCFGCPQPLDRQRESLLPQDKSESDEDEIGQIRKAVIAGNEASDISSITKRILGRSLANEPVTISRDCAVMEFDNNFIHVWMLLFYRLMRLYLRDAHLFVVCISSDELMQDKLEFVNKLMHDIQQHEELCQGKFKFLFVATRCELVPEDKWTLLLEKLQTLAKGYQVDAKSCLFCSAESEHNLKLLRRLFVQRCYPEQSVQSGWYDRPELLEDAVSSESEGCTSESQDVFLKDSVIGL